VASPLPSPPFFPSSVVFSFFLPLFSSFSFRAGPREVERQWRYADGSGPFFPFPPFPLVLSLLLLDHSREMTAEVAVAKGGVT